MRILALLEEGELSVQELQEITHLGQSRISTHLGLLQDSELVRPRREGKRSFYSLDNNGDPVAQQIVALAVAGAKELPEYAADQVNLKRTMDLRLEPAKLYFNQVAGRFDRSYGPGRSWQAFGHLLLRMLPPLVIADLGSGEGLISELLARRAKKVIAVDNSEKIVAFGAAQAKKNGIRNLEFRLGDLETPPIDPGSVDCVIISQSLHHANNPKTAVESAFRVLRPGGHIMILDLLKHTFEPLRLQYGDLWPGFAESDLHHWLEIAGFRKLEIQVVDRQEESPHFQTIMATAEKPA